MAFIGHDRDAAVQRALANAAVASAQADAAARVAGDVGRNATIGPYSGSFNEWVVETPENFFHAKRYNGHSIVDMGSMISGSIGISTAWTEQVLASVKVDLLRNCGTAGKVLGGASVGMGGVGLALGVASGWKTKESGNLRGYLDMGVSLVGGGTALLMTAGLIGTGGWMIVIPCAIYGIAVGIHDW